MLDKFQIGNGAYPDIITLERVASGYEVRWYTAATDEVLSHEYYQWSEGDEARADFERLVRIAKEGFSAE